MTIQKPQTAKHRDQIFALLMDNDVDHAKATAPAYLDDAAATAFINRAMKSFRAPQNHNAVSNTSCKEHRVGQGGQRFAVGTLVPTASRP